MAFEPYTGTPKQGKPKRGHMRKLANGGNIRVSETGEFQPIAIRNPNTGVIEGYKVPYHLTDEEGNDGPKKWAQGKTQALALKNREAKLQAHMLGLQSRKDTRTVAALLEEWLENGRKRRDWSVKTYQGYVDQIRTYIVPYVGRIRLDKLTATHVDAMMDKLAVRESVQSKKRREKAGGVGTPEYLSAKTIRLARGTLCAALESVMHLAGRGGYPCAEEGGRGWTRRSGSRTRAT